MKGWNEERVRIARFKLGNEVREGEMLEESGRKSV